MNNSYIEKLHVKNVRQFKELNVLFNSGFNFISGPNGCGKTSVLACMSHCFHHSEFQYSRFNDQAEFWTDLTVGNLQFRVGLGQDSLQNIGYRTSSLRAWNAPPIEANRESVSTNNLADKTNKFCPLFIGAHRKIIYKQISGMSREQPLDQKYQSYISNNTKSLYGEWGSDIKQWLVNRYFMIEKDWAIEERRNWEHLIASLPNIGPFDSKFSFIRIEKDLEPIFSIYGKECYLEELSAGFQAVLSIIANIFEWIEGSKEDGNRNAKDATGSVLIDELDLHLHPEWQFTLRSGLETIFPKLQFIVTTHSPHLLASAKTNEVIVMPGNTPDGIYNLSPSNRTYSGWNTDQILSDVMGVISLDNKDYERLITDAFLQIERRSITGLESTINALQSICHPSDTIVTVLNARLASMVALKND